MSEQEFRVLVAEPDEVNAHVVRTILERLGCTVDLVGNGSEVVDLFNERRYDVIFMAGHMPGMNGFEATLRLRALGRGQNVPIIGTSASADRAVSLSAGMTDVMPKPYETQKIKKILERWARRADGQSC